MGECTTCFGNGFIVIGAMSEPCPDCWGTGQDDSDADDAEDGEESDDEEDATSCWDADRLELGRVGVDPDPSYFNTLPAIELVRSGSLRKLRGLRIRKR